MLELVIVSFPFSLWNVSVVIILPSPPLDNIRVMVIVWRLRGNIIRTAPWCVVWHNVHSQQHTYMSSSYRSSRLGLSHWDPYAMRRGVCLELYYCNMVEWSWWDSGRQIFRIGTVRYAEGLGRMSRHGPVIAHCTDSEDFPSGLICKTYLFPSVFWHCWFCHMTCKNPPRYNL